MAFNVAALSAYVKENADKLIAATLMSSKTAKLIEQFGTVLTEVKSSEKIGQLETDATFQDGSVCGFTSSGSTVFSQRTVTVGDIKIEEELCLKNLEKKYTQQMLSAGANYDSPDDFDFNQWWIDRKVTHAANALEVAIWQGDTTSGDGQLNKFDGLIKQITGAADEINANHTDYITAVITTAGGGITQANVISVLQAIVKATPTKLKQQSDYRVFCGYDVIEMANLALYDANKFHHTASNPDEFMIPGTTVKAVAVPGLDRTKGLFGFRLSNVYVGTDLLSDTTEVKVWYNIDEEKTRYRNAFKYGVNVAITAECVKFIPA
jgi:hypothetical protein